MNATLRQRIEEAAREYNIRAYSPFDDNYELSRQFENDCNCFKEGATFALQNQWISVEDALPKKNGLYLTLNINSTNQTFADTCQWNAKGKYWYTELCGDVFYHERTHWMEIPKLKDKNEP